MLLIHLTIRCSASLPMLLIHIAIHCSTFLSIALPRHPLLCLSVYCSALLSMLLIYLAIHCSALLSMLLFRLAIHAAALPCCLCYSVRQLTKREEGFGEYSLAQMKIKKHPAFHMYLAPCFRAYSGNAPTSTPLPHLGAGWGKERQGLVNAC